MTNILNGYICIGYSCPECRHTYLKPRYNVTDALVEKAKSEYSKRNKSMSVSKYTKGQIEAIREYIAADKALNEAKTREHNALSKLKDLFSYDLGRGERVIRVVIDGNMAIISSNSRHECGIQVHINPVDVIQ
jgi:hypothetical protein